MKLKLKKQIEDSVRKALKPHLRVVRKSAADDERIEVKERPFSISKYFRGAMRGNWDGAELEMAQYIEVNKISVDKALRHTPGISGGFLIPDEYSAELIELLRAKAVVRQMGPTIYPVTGDTLKISRQTGAATAYWVSDVSDTAANITASEQTFDQVELVLKEVAALVPVSNTLIDDASPAVDTIIKNDLVKVLSLAEDLSLIQGTGGTQPLGIYNDPTVGTTTLGSGNGAGVTYDDLMDAMYAIEANNGTYTGWVANPRTKNGIRQLKDGNGNYIYVPGATLAGPGAVNVDSLLGLPIRYTTQIPTTLTFGSSGAVCSYMILANWPELAIGQKTGIKIDASEQAGTSFQRNQTWFRALLRVDGVVRQGNEFYIIKGCT